MSWAQSRQKAVEEGRFETKQIAPSYSRKVGEPHRARKAGPYLMTPQEEARISRTVGRVLRQSRKSGGSTISEARKRELERRFDRVISELENYASESRHRANGRGREHRDRASQPARERQTESPLPPSEVYRAARRTRAICLDLIGDLLPVPVPLIRWRSPQYMRRVYGKGVVGLCRRDKHRSYVEVDNSLSPRETASVVSHELMHTAQFGIGAANLSDSEREVAEEQANRFSLFAYAEYIDRYGPLPG